MSRRFAVESLNSDFLLVLFVETRPVTTLTGSNKDDLVDIGREWVAAQLPSFCDFPKMERVNWIWPPPQKWTGVERRRNFRTPAQ